MARYDYDRGYGRGRGAGYGWYPGAFWGGVPLYGWGAWGGGWGWPPYVPMGYGAYDANYTPRRPPEQSPAYGRGGDRLIRRGMRREGYDAGYAIQPHRPRRPRYDRGW